MHLEKAKTGNIPLVCKGRKQYKLERPKQTQHKHNKERQKRTKN